ncbi:hypothetical protein GN956_G13260 [Arapaima gigas]
MAFSRSLKEAPFTPLPSSRLSNQPAEEGTTTEEVGKLRPRSPGVPENGGLSGPSVTSRAARNTEGEAAPFCA